MSDADVYFDHACDLCGSTDAVEIEVARHYTGGRPVHVCRDCGFIHVRQRRSAERIAQLWSDEIYGDTYEYGRKYTARTPAMLARQTYVAAFAHANLDLPGKRLVDIGAGEGQFLDIVRRPPFDAHVFGVEPSARNGRIMETMGIPCFVGTAEAYAASPQAARRRFDIATLMWTLVNCRSPRALLEAAWNALDDGGHVVIGEGSRILVPFRKPLQYYFANEPQDTHAFHFSANTLRGFLATSGFEVTAVNRYIDTDHLTLIGRKVDKSRPMDWPRDDWRRVIDFFERWHRETRDHYADA